jgi:methylenetetrahydromethanopterin dehydrogenase
VIKVLATTGAFNLVVEALEKTITSLKAGGKPELPKIVIDGASAIEAAGYQNPYAKAKAMAAYEMASRVSKLTTEACFRLQDSQIYVPLVAAAHEMMRVVAKLADEARELEKGGNTVLRKPHFKDGALGTKRRLAEKPKKIE